MWSVEWGFRIAIGLLLAGPLAGLHAEAAPVAVHATVETTPVPSSGDAADDPSVWLHPTDPSLSLIIGTDKNAGLATYGLDGVQLQFLPVGDLNNVDVRYNFMLSGVPVDVVVAGNRTDHSLDVFVVDPVTRLLTDVAAGPLPVGVSEPYGVCLYRSWIDGKIYAFVNDQDGLVEQYELIDNGSGQIGVVLVRAFAVGGQTEGMVADDAYALLYIGEENYGIWRYGAEPTAGAERVEVDTTAGPHLAPDVEGLAIYHTSSGGGYLIASSQGDNSYAVYERQAPAGVPNLWLKSFQIIAGGIDGCEETDGIDVFSAGLGPAFPQGAFIAQDGSNPGANQNYKLVPWPAVASRGTVPLVIDTAWDPRAAPGVISGACCLAAGAACGLFTPAGCTAQGGQYQGDGTACEAALCEEPVSCPADVDGDRIVAVSDLVDVIANWGQTIGPADVNGDGIVGVLDLVAVIAAWGPCGP